VPEGDTIFRAARALHRALAGGIITRFESVFPSLNRVADDRPIVGRTMTSVAARGKHVLMTFSDDLVLRTHMRMNGSWHLYRSGARWKAPARDMRLIVATATVVAVGFNVPVAEFLTMRDLARHRELRALGPDLLADTFDRADVLTRMRPYGRQPIAEVLLNQRVVAGVGNEFKSEVLFLAAIHPHRTIANFCEASATACSRWAARAAPRPSPTSTPGPTSTTSRARVTRRPACTRRSAIAVGRRHAPGRLEVDRGQGDDDEASAPYQGGSTGWHPGHQ